MQYNSYVIHTLRYIVCHNCVLLYFSPSYKKKGYFYTSISLLSLLYKSAYALTIYKSV